ncbi:adenylate/guanylate cyclase domain-containing protein [Microvirga roseola]|uniref:adenylate/guanylate cyclase domain-containing protein n=1 Tax=Microvirga roseola TaxID=2883126 RepID=UPI001E4D87FC|nr:adenylate/guanylate cyclase domain-containing protein [Microvirga roseola]
MPPHHHPVARKLAAILAADIAGFSRLMGRDEEGTLEHVKRLRSEIVAPSLERHRGRLVKITGDGFLIEFGSSVDAVRCAVDIQERLARETISDRAEPLQLRVGINLGDIIVDEDGDIYGDGVNVAARLEQLAEPGAICLSGKVYEEVRDKLPYAFEDEGERRVKNIARPLKIYRIAPPTRTTATPGSAHPFPTPRDMPSIAVLPFTNMSGDAEREFFADGMTEDIITALSRLRWLLVIARNSTFAYKGRAVDVRQVARDLGVRYVLEGSVRASGNRIRITGQLIDAESGKHIWAERYDRLVEDVFAVQDEITEHVVAAIEPHLYAEEGYRAQSRATERIDIWGLVVSALTLINRATREANREAQILLHRAIAIEPGYARAHAILGWAIWWETFCYWRPPEEGFREMMELARRALALDPQEPWGRMIFGFSLSTTGHHDRALEQMRGALDMNPSWALGRTLYGVALLRAGYAADAVSETGRAVRMSPLDTFAGIYTAFHGLTLLGDRRFEEALPYLRRSVLVFPEFPGHCNALISCCGHLGLIEEAQAQLQHRNRIGPPLTLEQIRRNLRHHAHCALFVEGLAKAGVPEHDAGSKEDRSTALP